jgi:hypothetical protein
MRLKMTILSLALLFGSTVYAQPDPGESPMWANQSFSVDYEGGPLDDFVGRLEQQLPGLNLIVHTQAKDIAVQPLSLKNVNAMVAISALQELLEPRIEVFEVKGPSSESKVMILRPRQVPLRTTAFHLGEQPNGGAAKTLEVIEFSITSLPDADKRTKPKVKLHEPSGILLVTADKEQLSLIGKVIGMLGGTGSSGGGEALFNGGPYPGYGAPSGDGGGYGRAAGSSYGGGYGGSYGAAAGSGYGGGYGGGATGSRPNRRARASRDRNTDGHETKSQDSTEDDPFAEE